MYYVCIGKSQCISCTHTHIHTHTHTRTHTHIHTHTYIHTHVHTHTLTRIHTRTHTHTHTHVHTHTHTHIHTHCRIGSEAERIGKKTSVLLGCVSRHFYQMKMGRFTIPLELVFSQKVHDSSKYILPCCCIKTHLWRLFLLILQTALIRHLSGSSIHE